jgi:hypothetical protein
VGVNVAKGIGECLPLVGINHLEGTSTALVARRSDGMALTICNFRLILIVSGGHTELIFMRDHLQYEKLGATLDDASGEAYDKVARLLQLGYPGGPKIEKIAVEGNPHAFRFNKPKVDDEFAFSFSGIKTAVLRAVQNYGADRAGWLDPGARADSRSRCEFPAQRDRSTGEQDRRRSRALWRHGDLAQRRRVGQQAAALCDEDQGGGAGLLAAAVVVHRQRRHDRRGAFPLPGWIQGRMGFGY